jgi:MFS family permease
MLIVGRAVAGIGGSGLLNGGLTIIRACVPNEKSPSMRKPTVVVF